MSELTAEQVKGRIKNVAKERNADPRILMRIYMMERFLERVSLSDYKNNFIIKGGVLITSMVGISLRSTMDIDTSIKNCDLNMDNAKEIITEICNINLHDGITFNIKDISNIMSVMQYPGIRFSIDAVLEEMITPIKIDVSTGDIITPHAIEYSYKLLLEERSISLLSYNLETIIAEKLQTLLSRGILNTRMRDYYDLHILLSIYDSEIINDVLIQAFNATCKERKTENIKNNIPKIIDTISNDTHMKDLWKSYQKKYNYAAIISFEEVIQALNNIANRITN